MLEYLVSGSGRSYTHSPALFHVALDVLATVTLPQKLACLKLPELLYKNIFHYGKWKYLSNAVLMPFKGNIVRFRYIRDDLPTEALCFLLLSWRPQFDYGPRFLTEASWIEPCPYAVSYLLSKGKKGGLVIL